jgi:hypothetical protein
VPLSLLVNVGFGSDRRLTVDQVSRSLLKGFMHGTNLQ